jgi:WD40 repeat protein
MGELQIWDLYEGETFKPHLSHSIPVTYDTIYGASWSPDGKLVAVGCSDKVVRAFDSSTGAQAFFAMAHDDWAVGDSVLRRRGLSGLDRSGHEFQAL